MTVLALQVWRRPFNMRSVRDETLAPADRGVQRLNILSQNTFVELALLFGFNTVKPFRFGRFIPQEMLSGA